MATESRFENNDQEFKDFLNSYLKAQKEYEETLAEIAKINTEGEPASSSQAFVGESTEIGKHISALEKINKLLFEEINENRDKNTKSDDEEVNTEEVEIILAPEEFKKRSRLMRITMKATLILMGLGTLGYTGGRYNDSVNKAISEYVNKDLANIVKLPPLTGLRVAYNGITKKLGIGDYAVNTTTKPINIEAPGAKEGVSKTKELTAEEIRIAEAKKPLVESYVIGESAGDYHGRDIKPFLINMKATSGYTFNTYNNLDGLGQKDPVKDIEGSAILGGIQGILKPFKGINEKIDSNQLYMVMNSDHRMVIKRAHEMKKGEICLIMTEPHITKFNDIDIETGRDGIQTIGVEYNKNLGTAILHGKDGRYAGIGLTHQWENKERIPLNEATAYSQSRGGMVFIYSEDLQDQYLVGGSFYTMWDVYTKLQAKHPERTYSFFRHDHGSYSNSLFGKQKDPKTGKPIVSCADQQLYSAQNSWGTMQMLTINFDTSTQ